MHTEFLIEVWRRSRRS